nr:kinesin-like protein KIN-12C isoform X2 [Ipomoea trifida]
MLYYLFFILPILRFSSAFYVKFLELIEYGGNYWMPKHASREGYQVGSVLDECELVKSTPHQLPVHEEDFLDKSNQQVENALILEYDDMKKQLMESRSLMEEMELQQVHLIEGIEVLKEENCRLLGMVDRNEHIRKQPGSLCESCESQVCLEYTDLNLALRGSADITLVGLQGKLEKVSKDLEEACLVNGKCIEEHAQKMTMKHQHELICEEVEMETAKTILLLQEEISQIKSEFQEKLSSMAEEIISLKDTLAAKEEEMKVVCAEWERATLDLTNFLTDGSKSLQDAGWQIESIACSFPNVDLFIGEHVERAAKTYIEKEETILLLKKSLEEAQQTVFQMEEKLLSLKGATIAFAEAQQQVNDASSEEGIQLATGLSDTTSNITFLENKLNHSEVQINEAERCASFDLSAVNSVSDLPELTYVIDIKDQPLISVQNFGMTSFNNEIESTKREVLELENAIKTSCHDAERLFSVIKSDGYNNVLFFKDLIQDIVNDIRELQRHFTELKEKHGRVQLHSVGVESSNSNEISGCYTVRQMLHKILYELVGTNDSLNHINACFYKLLNPYGYLGAAEESINSDGSTDCSTSSSYPSDGSDGSILSSDLRGSNIVQNLVMNSSQEEILYFLSKEFRSTYNVFAKLKAHFDTSFCRKEIHNCLCSSPCFSNLLELSKSNDHCVMGNESEVIMPEVVPGLEVIMSEAETGCNLVRELKLNDKTSQASRFFNKFEEAYRTIKEADHTLQALTKANEGAKELNCMWKRAGEEFMVERARLDEEIRQLNSDVNGTESKYGKLQNQMHHTFTEIASSISSIEDTFQETQKYVDTLCKSVLSDAFGMVKETMSCICNSRLLLEEIFTNIEGTGLASLVLNRNLVFQPAALQEGFLALSNTGESYVTYDNGMLRKVKAPTIKTTGSEEIDLVHANSMNENAELRRELERKEALLKGLLFDFSLLQESASSKKDVKDEIDKLIAALSQVENELRIKNNQHNDMIVQHRTLENQFKEGQSALFSSHSDLLEARRKLEILSKENAELRELLEDIYLKKSETEEELREQMKAVEMLEKEIILLTSSTDNQVNGEKIQLLEQVRSLQDKLDVACALANENEAIAVEARQESEASKIYAEQKEEEVKILEHSVEELDGTINILEKKVHEMEEEVEQHHMIRESLELELQALKERLLTVENFTEKLELKNSGSQLTKDQFPRSLSHQKAYDQIKILEIEKAELVKEVKQCKEYVSELLLHAEAQALQYQQKYKDLEAMVHEFRTDSSNLENQVSTSDKIEKVSTRIRGSSSPFRCISSLVQQMNSEKDQELSVAKLRIEELEALAAQRQKEVCILNNRLAAAENMTHDVIRDLLGVKLDMTTYADLIDQHQLQKFIVEAHQQSLEYSAMEKEVLNLRRQLNDLIEEREAFILQVKRREAIELATQMSIEQLRERDQLLTAQNEMLKVDKTNLQSKVVEMDEMVKNLLGTQNIQPQNHSLLRLDDADRGKRLVNSKKLALGMNDKSYHYYRGPKGTK